MVRYLAACATVLALVSTTQAALEIGDKAPDFKSLEATDGKKISLADYKQDVLVVAITCNHCPVAVMYEDRMIEFCKKHAGAGKQVAFVAINVNNSEADKLPAMKERAKEKGFNFSYAYDPSQQIARDLGAKVTPHFFVFNKNRELIYMGAMDDNNDESKVKVNYIEQAVEAALTGSNPPASTKARGCGVRYE